MARQELLNATDAEIEDAIAFADPIVLRGLLYQLTGDESLTAIPQGIISVGFRGEIPAITDPEAAALIRRKAADFLKAYRDSGAGDQPLGPPERLHRAMELTAGENIPEVEHDMWVEQFAFDPFVRGLDWKRPPSAAARDGFHVAVIGAGMGGLNSGVLLQQAGIPFTIIEKNGEVGGTWHENRYPGARVDTASRIYVHSFGINDYQCPNPFCEQDENEKYFKWVADHFGLRDSIRFRTEVESIIWDEADELWTLTVTGPGGRETIRANAVISGVGFLNRPNLPELPGADGFKGQIIHTARWPQELELAGKRVAVIGSGATGYQMIPVLAKQVEHLTLFQRHPSWCYEVPGYLSPYPAQVNWLDRNFPYMANFLRFHASWLGGPDGLGPLFAVDPDFKDPHAVSAHSQRLRELVLATLKRKFGDRTDLIEKMTPKAPPMTSRPVLVDVENNIYDALMRNNVSLVSEEIAEITPDGIRTVDGIEHQLDIIVYATGFKANDFLFPMEVRGRGGRSIEQLWEKDGARAYLGSMLPGFPNLFMLYGPNMNPFGNGLGVVEMQEMATRFALRCIETMILDDKRSVDVTEDAYWRYNDALDAAEATKVYADPRVISYFKNGHGRSAVNNPLDVRLFWGWLLDPAAEERVIAPQPVPSVKPQFGEDLILS